MKLSIEFKPKRVVANTKAEILSKISNNTYSYMYTGNGNYLCNSFAETDPKTIRVYSVEKRRKKVKRIIKDNRTVFSQVISPDHWIGYYYDIPYQVIKCLNLRIQQSARTFKISQK